MLILCTYNLDLFSCVVIHMFCVMQCSDTVVNRNCFSLKMFVRQVKSFIKSVLAFFIFLFVECWGKPHQRDESIDNRTWTNGVDYRSLNCLKEMLPLFCVFIRSLLFAINLYFLVFIIEPEFSSLMYKLICLIKILYYSQNIH